MGGADNFSDARDVKADETIGGRIGVGAIALAEEAATCCEPAAELALLKRLRDNLGNLSNGDLGRSLRLAGSKSAPLRPSRG